MFSQHPSQRIHTDTTSFHPSLIDGEPQLPLPTRLCTRRILVADDNVDAAETCAILLRLYGSEVVCAWDGADALAAFERFEPEAVILDISMPRLDGYEVAREIRERTDRSDVLLIAMSGWARPEDRAASLAAGFDHHLVKPVHFAALMSILL